MNRVVKCLLELEEHEARIVAEEIEELYPPIHNDIEKYMKLASLTYVEALEYVVTVNVVVWAKIYLNWTARDYQIEMLEQGVESRRLVLRLGRRLGKTEVMCVLILWYAYTQRNRVSETQYDILIVGPYETQVDLIFARLGQLIENAPILSECIEKIVEHKIVFKNGTTIQGKTAGASSGGTEKAGAGTRGLRGDLLVLDECDYTGSAQITNIMNILNDNPKTSKLIAASTPCGKREEFYKWCTNASRTYRAKKEDIDNFRFTGYEFVEQGNGNGWTQIYAPSVVNKNLLEINEDTGRSYLEDLKYELSELRFEQEVMAEFGEEELGIYQKQYIDAAIEEGRRIRHTYLDNYTKEQVEVYKRSRRLNKWMMGVDWDKYGSCTNFVILEYDRMFKNVLGNIEPKFKVLFRVEIPRGKFTYVNAVDKIIQLNDIWDFDYIAIDRGYGELMIA